MLKGYDWLAKLELLPHRPGSHEVQAAYAHEIIRGHASQNAPLIGAAFEPPWRQPKQHLKLSSDTSPLRSPRAV
jgi:hypothetical protein